MKLTNGKRILMVVHWVCSLLIGIALTLFIINPRMALAFGGADGRIPAGVMVLSILIIAAYVVLSVVQAYFVLNLEKKSVNDYYPVGATDNGPVRISTPAIEQMVRHAVHDLDGISDMRIDIQSADDGIDIAVEAILLNGAHVPTVTANMQSAIGKFVESACGVKVCSVSISVVAVAKAQTRLKAHTFTEWLSRVGKAIKAGVARLFPKKQAAEATDGAADATVVQPVDEVTETVEAVEPEAVEAGTEEKSAEAEPVAYDPATVEPEVVIIEPELDDEEPELIEDEPETVYEVEPEAVEAELVPVEEVEPETVDEAVEPVDEVEPEPVVEEAAEATEPTEEAPAYEIPVVQLEKPMQDETDVEE